MITNLGLVRFNYNNVNSLSNKLNMVVVKWDLDVILIILLIYQFSELFSLAKFHYKNLIRILFAQFLCNNVKAFMNKLIVAISNVLNLHFQDILKTNHTHLKFYKFFRNLRMSSFFLRTLRINLCISVTHLLSKGK